MGDCREAFEKWCADNGWTQFDGEDPKWEIWQAAWNSRPAGGVDVSAKLYNETQMMAMYQWGWNDFDEKPGYRPQWALARFTPVKTDLQALQPKVVDEDNLVDLISYHQDDNIPVPLGSMLHGKTIRALAVKLIRRMGKGAV